MKSPRTRSIRAEIAVLLFVPLISLIALWGYAASVTVGDALAQRRYHTLDRKFAPSGQGVLIELGKERLASAIFLSTPESAAPEVPAELRAQRAKVDAAVAFFRKEATGDVARGATNAAMEQRVADVLDELDMLRTSRAAVDDRSVDRLEAVQGYNRMVDAMHRAYDALVVIDDSSLYNWTLSTRAAGRALELIQRENALVAGAFVTKNRMTAAEHRMFVEMVGEQRQQWVKQRSLLDPAIYNTGTAQVFASQQYRAFRMMEDRIAEQGRGALPVSAGEWQATAQPLVLSINKMVLTNSKRAGEHADDLGRSAYIRVGVVGGVGLLAVIVSILLSLRFGRGLGRELVGLRRSAQEMAEQRLPGVVERLRRNESVDVAAEVPALQTRGKIDEVVKVSEAFASVQRTAVDAAVGQAELRRGVSRIFLNIARRNQSLLHRQLTMLDTLESRAEADDLDDLFRLDHLTTRMRRHAESLIILSGATPGRGWRQPQRIVDVLRGAVAEIEEYTRAKVMTDSADGLVGPVVTDVVHLLAELVENAVAFSPPNTDVRVLAERVGSGFVVEIEDRGLGVQPELLASINARLAEPPEFDLVDTDQLGLFVVARLAARHNIKVSLNPSPYGGTTAIVLLPHELVVPAEHMTDAMASAEAERQNQGPRETPRRPVPVPQLHAQPPAPPAPPPPPAQVVQPEPPAPVVQAEPPAPVAETEPSSPPTPPAQAVPSLQAPAEPTPAPPPPTPSRRLGNPWFDDAPELPQHSQSPAPAPVPENGEAPVNGEAPATHAGLPRRVRQENLAPQLRKERPAAPDLATGPVARSPEEARSLMASMQQGWRRGRESDVEGEDEQ
ncbi:sensor histidine kinase [Actinomadura rudentiformis]|uniref:histidine kinase n=1 Tax=Actinomadura rudentiformis TaxID=359158 RepID=A0A6H9YPA7_9ACTN|nr:sensor histidine kinase [Actinomadura rudentiformis]KAB2343311.1 sensor histidine kinase [Actinomadura rudentiformis]